MKLLLDTYKQSGSLHHAYCLLGEKTAVCGDLLLFLKKTVGVETIGNPDFWRGDYNSFGIEEGRHLQEMQSRKAFGGGKKIFVLTFNSITREAQNSLLKVFEEPTAETHFFLIIPSTEVLLPTLLSRLMIVRNDGNNSTDVNILSLDFLKSSIPRRLEIIKELSEKISEGEKTKADAILLLNGIETSMREKIGNRPFTTDEAFLFAELGTCRSYLQDRSPSVKMLLEHVALIIP